MQDQQGEGWTKVGSSGRPARKKESSTAAFPYRQTKVSGPTALEKQLARIAELVDKLQETPLFLELKASLAKAFPDRPLMTAVCYGIGPFTSSPGCRLQLALLILLTRALKIEKVYLYDPVLDEEEQALLSKLSIELIPENEEGKRKAQGLTLYYMPHCAKTLYNNVVEANWDNSSLTDVIILGNSFDNYLLWNKKGTTPSLELIEGLYEEVSLPEYKDAPNVFNNTSLHTFPPIKLATKTETYWDSIPPPAQADSDSDLSRKTA